MYIITLFPFESLKSFEQKKTLNIIIQQHFNDHSFEKKKFNKWIFFVNIIILPMLSYFQLLYDYFSLI